MTRRGSGGCAPVVAWPRMRLSQRARSALAPALVGCLLACSAGGEPALETPGEIAAARVVPEALRRGDGYRVADPVRADGFALHYTVESDAFGSVEASSSYMLPLRIQELRALGALSRIRGRDAFKDAAIESAKTPVRVVQELATDPVETIEGAGRGAKKAVSKAAGWLSGDRRERSESEDSAFSEAIGRSRRKRQLAGALGVDVYSSNAQLQEELDRVAWSSVSGGLSFTALMAALPIPPALSAVQRTTGFTAGLNELMVTRSGGDLYRMNREILRGMGMPDSRTEPFLDNAAASPRHKTFIVAALREMRGVEGLERFVDLGRALANEEQALRLQRLAELARGYHVNVSPLREVVELGDMVALVSESGTLAAALPADRLLWTAETRDLSDDLRELAETVGSGGSTQLWVSGDSSDAARDALEERDIALYERAADRLEVDSGG